MYDVILCTILLGDLLSQTVLFSFITISCITTSYFLCVLSRARVLYLTYVKVFT